jgi:hypothetical protein
MAKFRLKLREQQKQGEGMKIEMLTPIIDEFRIFPVWGSRFVKKHLKKNNKGPS